MHSPATHGLWEASAPPPVSTEALTGEHVADVVVIGAGYTGCSAALHLARAGKRAVLLEANEIGFGGSGRNVGLVNAGMWAMPDQVRDTLGDVFGERLLEQLGGAPRLVFEIVSKFGIECEVERSGTLHCGVGSSGLREVSKRAAQWYSRGADVQLLDAQATARIVGSEAYSGALLDRRAGTIQPLAYVRGLARAAIDNGASLHTRSPVTSVESVGANWKVATALGSVSAASVIVATDAYSTGPWTGLRREQVMLPYFNAATRPLGRDILATILPGRQGVWDTKQILSSFRLDKSGRLVFGSVGALRGPGKAIHPSWGRRALKRLFPQLGRIEFEHEWYGMIGMTDDALPRFHQLDRNVFSISGYNGRGIAPGTTFGRDLARLCTGEVAPEDLSLPLTELGEASMRHVKSAFYEVGAQVAHFTDSRFDASTFRKADNHD